MDLQSIHSVAAMNHCHAEIYSIAGVEYVVGILLTGAYLWPYEYTDNTEDIVWSWMILDDNFIVIVQAAVFTTEIESADRTSAKGT